MYLAAIVSHYSITVVKPVESVTYTTGNMACVTKTIITISPSYKTTAISEIKQYYT